MLSLLWSFLKSLTLEDIAVFALVLIVLTLGGSLWIKTNEIDSLNNKITANKIEIKRLTDDNLKLITSVTEQNAQVELMTTRTKQLSSALDNAAKANVVQNENTTTLIEQIKKSYVPKDCVGAASSLESFVTTFAAEWNKKN